MFRVLTSSEPSSAMPLTAFCTLPNKLIKQLSTNQIIIYIYLHNLHIKHTPIKKNLKTSRTCSLRSTWATWTNENENPLLQDGLSLGNHGRGATFWKQILNAMCWFHVGSCLRNPTSNLPGQLLFLFSQGVKPQEHQRNIRVTSLAPAICYNRISFWNQL